MLNVSRLSRNYGSFKAVDDVSFSIGRGEIVGLLGHNGAGKTTIMKMISGYLEPDQGAIQVDDVSLADYPHQVQAGLGYLPENLPVYPEMTVADYLDYAADMKALRGHLKQDEIKRVIDATQLSSKLLAPIATLSRGYKQRVGVAQALLGRPKLLILDEPTNGLDPEQTHAMRQLIQAIAVDATVILSTHIMQEVDAICSRVLILRSGRLAVDARLDELRRSHHLLLESSLAEADARQLNNIAGVETIQLIDTEAPKTGRHVDQEENLTINHYRLKISPSINPKTLSAQLADSVMQMGHKLYSLMPEHRDLETLFREVNDDNYQEELSNAA